MTDQPMTDSRSKWEVGNSHIGKIMTAIADAEADGFTLDIDPDRDRDYNLIGFDIDLHYEGIYMGTIRTVEWDERDL